MKRNLTIIWLLILGCCMNAGDVRAQDADPALTGFTITNPLTVGGTGTARITLSNNGLTHPTPPGSFTVDISFPTTYLPDPLNATAVEVTPGSFASKFNWSYDVATRTISGTPHDAIPAGEGGVITIRIKGISLSAGLDFSTASITPNPLELPNDDPLNNVLQAGSRVDIELPVVLSSFNVKTDNCTNVLNWVISSSADFSHFEVERSSDGTSFASVGKLLLAHGVNDYQFTDKVSTGTYYYRLNMVDLDTRREYSKTLITRNDCMGQSVFWSVYANPVVSGEDFHVKVTSSLSLPQKFRVFIMTVDGKMLMERALDVSAGEQVYTLSSANLVPGIYSVRIMGEDNALLNETRKLVIR